MITLMVGELMFNLVWWSILLILLVLYFRILPCLLVLIKLGRTGFVKRDLKTIAHMYKLRKTYFGLNKKNYATVHYISTFFVLLLLAIGSFIVSSYLVNMLISSGLILLLILFGVWAYVKTSKLSSKDIMRFDFNWFGAAIWTMHIDVRLTNKKLEKYLFKIPQQLFHWVYIVLFIGWILAIVLSYLI